LSVKSTSATVPGFPKPLFTGAFMYCSNSCALEASSGASMNSFVNVSGSRGCDGTEAFLGR
jgi:hypothetical protein